MSKQDSIASCLAKIYESKLESSTGSGKSTSKAPGVANSTDRKLNLLNEKVDKLLNFQEDVLGRLERVHHGMDALGRGVDKLSEFHSPGFPAGPEIKPVCHEEGRPVTEHSINSELLRLLRRVQEDSMVHQEKLDSLEKMVSTMDKVVEFVGNTLRNSKIVEFILKGTVPWRTEKLQEAKDSCEEKEAKTKNILLTRGAQGEVKSSDRVTDPKRTSVLGNKGIVHKAGQCHSPQTRAESTIPITPHETAKHGPKTSAGQRSGEKGSSNMSKAHHRQAASDRSTRREELSTQGGGNDQHHNPSSPTSSMEDPTDTEQPTREVLCTQRDNMTELCQGKDCTASAKRASKDDVTSALQSKDDITSPEKHPSPAVRTGKVPASPTKNATCAKSSEIGEKRCLTQQRNEDTGGQEQAGDPNPGSQEALCPGQGVTGETQKGEEAGREPDAAQGHGATLPGGPNMESVASFPHIIDDCPPPPAPFNHRIVSIKQAILSSCYNVCQNEVLGGGRFGQVHKCVEIASGLRLAAKIVRVKGPKDRDEVKNEINVMNQLNHVNLIQLYDAFECKNDLTLIMEYLDGGELFDRITDEKYNMTELDGIMFTKQICEGVYYLHQQYILHLDLKPENILCVNRTGNQIKIIDFGLARRYKPREKLRVNFGTPEFLAPEVVNYDFVSFPTDMWSVGVITYMLLSGLSPFLGESDAETMNYIVNCCWDFDSETFKQISEEAKDFIARLLVKEKSCRLSAGQCLKHDWLVSLSLKAQKFKVRLKSQVLLHRYLAQKKWKKHFYAVTAANRLRKRQLLTLKPS
ncbi:myosin light chain kinase 3 [Pelodytes ibericus]